MGGVACTDCRVQSDCWSDGRVSPKAAPADELRELDDVRLEPRPDRSARDEVEGSSSGGETPGPPTMYGAEAPPIPGAACDEELPERDDTPRLPEPRPERDRIEARDRHVEIRPVDPERDRIEASPSHAESRAPNPLTVDLGEGYREFRLRMPGYSRTQEKAPSGKPMYDFVSAACVSVVASPVGKFLDLPEGPADLRFPEYLLLQMHLPPATQGARFSLAAGLSSLGAFRMTKRYPVHPWEDLTPKPALQRALTAGTRSRSRFAVHDEHGRGLRRRPSVRLLSAFNHAVKAGHKADASAPPVVVFAFRLAEAFRGPVATCPAERLLERFVATAGGDASSVPLKTIVRLPNVAELPYTLRQMDGKPVLLTNSASVHRGTAHTGATFLEVDVDMAMWSRCACASPRIPGSRLGRSRRT